MSDIEVPTLCSKCLGDQQAVRMIKQPEGEACKMCTRPFTVFRWQGNDGSKRSSKTILCKTCSRARNCCQACMLDIDFLIPIEIRDTALKMAKLDHLISGSSGSRNSEVKALIADKQESKFNDEQVDTIKSNARAREILQKLAESVNKKTISAPIKTNSKSTKEDTAIPNNVAKLIQKLPFSGNLNIPQNQDTSFFVFGIPEDLPQYVISDYFEQFGKLKSVSIIHRAKCGFISFTSRKSAENLADNVLQNGLNTNTTTAGVTILNNNSPVRIAWSEMKQIGMTSSEHKKIALVVDKVMQQLAEKDTKSSKRPDKRKSRTLKQSKTSTPSTPSKKLKH